MILSAIEYDARSVTGRNLRIIMMESGKYNTSDLDISDCESITYHKLEEEDAWKVEVITNILEERDACGLEEEDVALLEYLCCG